MLKTPILSILILLFTAWACTRDNDLADAYGNFEAKDFIISSETQGKIISLNMEEGDKLEANVQIGTIDSTQVFLSLQQLHFKKQAVSSNVKNILSQIEVQQEQKKILLREKERLDNLFQDGAATEKQLDDVSGKIDLIEKQIKSIETQNSAVLSEINALDRQIAQVSDQVKRCRIVNPVKGTVIEKYIDRYEMTAPGKALYKIANLETMTLKVYVSGAQLPNIQLNQQVEVRYDSDKNSLKKTTGKIYWISDQAEFTPKIIQTKEERVKLVYAVKILVPNDGSIKIGMPGEVVFNKTTTP